METVNGGKIVLGLEINLILFYVGATGACTVSVKQPRYLEVDYTYNTVTIECTFSTAGCPAEQPTNLWFRYGAFQSENLCLQGCTSEADKFTVKKAPEQNLVSLTVNRLTVNDSAIYVCGIAFPSVEDPKAKQTGEGTTLVVREIKLLSKKMQSVLTALLSLLSVYIIGIGVGLTVLSKKKSARRIFQEIAQELYHKRYIETSQQSEKDNTYENRRALSNYEKP
ncbi:immunoglobulin superfamily member 6 isoform X2 [Tupaia chinensis]|uniref:immunoglobulin superfamily member 6 isoform X2 n=1 Tax=Tupaia chinensis TaxID=246437 RepID=UPI000703E50F|nr:immunoglobulin superfamily member 6 isoform X2 [Tupaia chinensis]